MLASIQHDSSFNVRDARFSVKQALRAMMRNSNGPWHSPFDCYEAGVHRLKEISIVLMLSALARKVGINLHILQAKIRRRDEWML